MTWTWLPVRMMLRSWTLRTSCGAVRRAVRLRFRRAEGAGYEGLGGDRCSWGRGCTERDAGGRRNRDRPVQDRSGEGGRYLRGLPGQRDRVQVDEERRC